MGRPEGPSLAERVASPVAWSIAGTQVPPPPVIGGPQKAAPSGSPVGLGFAPVLPGPDAPGFGFAGATEHPEPSLIEDLVMDKSPPRHGKLAGADSRCTTPDADCAVHKHEKTKELGLAVPLPLQALQEASKELDAELELENAVTWRNYVRKSLASPKCNLSIGIIIMANTVIMGVELDQHAMADATEGMISFLKPPALPQLFFDGCEVFFFFVFSVEFALRMFVYRFSMLREASAYVDFAALSPLIMTVVFDLNSDKSLTLLRIVRLLKLFRLLRLIRLFKELNVLALSIASALRALVWIGLLLLIVVYCAAIACTTVIGHNADFREGDPTVLAWEAKYESEAHIRRHWGSIIRSMFTLFQIFTLDDWGQAVRPVVETHQPGMILFFVIFLFITTFGLLNLLMGTIVDRAMNIAKEADLEKERILQEDYKQVMLAAVRLFSVMDDDGNGRLSADEINKFLEENDLAATLERELKGMKLKIDYLELLDICQSIVQEWIGPDDDEEDGITMEEFAGAAIKLQGNAKSKDLMSLMIMQKNLVHRVEGSEQSLDKILTMQEAIDKKVDSYKLYFEEHGAKLDALLQGFERGMGSGPSARSRPEGFGNTTRGLVRPQGAGGFTGGGFGPESGDSLAELASREPPRLTTGSAFSDGGSEMLLGEVSPAVLEGDLLGSAGKRGVPQRSAQQQFSLRDERQALREVGGRVKKLLKQINDQDDFAGAEVAAAMTRYAEQRDTGGPAKEPQGSAGAMDVAPRFTAPAFPSSWRRRASSAPDTVVEDAAPPLAPGMMSNSDQKGKSVGVSRRFSRMRLLSGQSSARSSSPRRPSDAGGLPELLADQGDNIADLAALPGSLPESI